MDFFAASSFQPRLCHCHLSTPSVVLAAVLIAVWWCVHCCLFLWCAALLQRVAEPNGSSRLQIVAQQQQTPAQRDVVRQLLPQAEECWWSPGHVGWTLFDLDAMARTAMQVCEFVRQQPMQQGIPQSLRPAGSPCFSYRLKKPLSEHSCAFVMHAGRRLLRVLPVVAE